MSSTQISMTNENVFEFVSEIFAQALGKIDAAMLSAGAANTHCHIDSGVCFEARYPSLQIGADVIKHLIDQRLGVEKGLYFWVCTN